MERGKRIRPPGSSARDRQVTALTADAELHLVPALIADAGDATRYVEFFTANIRNPHTRRAYARACDRFFAWCESRNLTLTASRPDVSCTTGPRSGLPFVM
jgi:hypothetical protein